MINNVVVRDIGLREVNRDEVNIIDLMTDLDKEE